MLQLSENVGIVVCISHLRSRAQDYYNDYGAHHSGSPVIVAEHRLYSQFIIPSFYIFQILIIRKGL